MVSNATAFGNAPALMGSAGSRGGGNHGVFLIGYDTESDDPTVTQPFLQRMLEIHEATNLPATLFLCGRTIARNLEALRPLVGHPLIDLQQHTYNHVLLKTICIEDPAEGIRYFRAGTLEQIREEVRRTNVLMRNELGVDCSGLTGPYAYYRGLVDRPDILEILWEEGIRFVRTWGRNERDWQPVDLAIQPFFYAVQGFPQMLEVPVHGWQDISLRKTVGWADHTAFLAGVYPYMERAASEGLVFSYVTHDHSSRREDAEMAITEALLRRALALGMHCLTYADYYAQCCLA
ncbi:MAG TPA: polysaccharide deacetylase family protein [Chloroflexota bacterium]